MGQQQQQHHQQQQQMGLSPTQSRTVLTRRLAARPAAEPAASAGRLASAAPAGMSLCTSCLLQPAESLPFGKAA